MTIDEVIQLLNTCEPTTLTSVEKLVLRSCWEGKTYTSMAEQAHYGDPHLRKVASRLWSLLSDFWGEPITKSNFRPTLEPRPLSLEQRLLIEALSYETETTSLEFPSGPVPLNSKFYISRLEIEKLAYAEIAKSGCVIRIKAPRKAGKSSLMLRIIPHAVSIGYHAVYLDFQRADEAVFASLDKFLRWFCANVSKQLQLEPMLDDYWDDDIGSKVSCTIYLQSYLLSKIDSPVVLVLNELNRIFEYPKIASEFLPLLRSWYEEAKLDHLLQLLRLVVVYSTEIYISLNLNQSPFNVGFPINLPEFTYEQILDLAQRHGLDWTDYVGTENVRSLQAMVGGHPYLVRLALYHLESSYQKNLDKLLESAHTITGIYRNELQDSWAILQSKPELATAFKQVIDASGGVELNQTIAYKLESMNLVKLDGNQCKVSCELYRKYFATQNLLL